MAADALAVTAPKTVLIDTDPGIDDALALILAMRSAALDVRCITVVAGNLPLKACTENTLRILDVLGSSDVPPVFEGCAHPMSPLVARAEHVHGSDGLGGVARSYPIGGMAPVPGHAADAMIAAARDYGNDLSIIALGPLTNVATAIQRDSAAMSEVREVIVMGGSLDGKGNVTPTAEFNFYSDPLAAQVVVRSDLVVTLVGLNVTERARLEPARFERCLESMQSGKLRSFLGDVARPYFESCRKLEGSDSCALHDPLAVAVAIDPHLVSLRETRVDVVTSQGLTRGMMVPGRPESTDLPVRVAVDVDEPAFLDLFLRSVRGS